MSSVDGDVLSTHSHVLAQFFASNSFVNKTRPRQTVLR